MLHHAAIGIRPNHTSRTFYFSRRNNYRRIRVRQERIKIRVIPGIVLRHIRKQPHRRQTHLHPILQILLRRHLRTSRIPRSLYRNVINRPVIILQHLLRIKPLLWRRNIRPKISWIKRIKRLKFRGVRRHVRPIILRGPRHRVNRQRRNDRVSLPHTRSTRQTLQSIRRSLIQISP